MTLEDVTERELREHRLRHEGTHDALTGLANRSYLIEQLEHRLRASQPRAASDNAGIVPTNAIDSSGAPATHLLAYQAAPFALLFIDVDDFKTINDTLGHAAGDACLQTIAKRLPLVV